MTQKITLAILALCIACSATAQNSRYLSDTKGSLFGIHFNAYDIETPKTLSSSTTPRKFSNIRDMDYGFSLSYWKGLSRTIDFSLKATGIFHDFSADDRNLFTTDQEFGAELEPTLNIRPYGDNSLIAPFLTAGIGGGYYTNKFGAYAPVGVGIQVNLMSESYIFLQAQYLFTVTPGTLSVSRPIKEIIRATFKPCSPSGVALPTITSSISSFSKFGNWETICLITSAARSSARVKRKTPRGALPTAVRYAAMMYASIFYEI